MATAASEGEAAYHRLTMRTAACIALIGFCLPACAYRAQTRATGWIQVDTEHLRLRTTLPAPRAVKLAREMQRIRDGLANSVFRCSFRQTVDRFAVTVLPRRHFDEIRPERVRGFYNRWSITWLPDYEGQIVLPDDLRVGMMPTFQHELAHHLVHTCIARPPVWLDEGLAELLETAVVEDRAVRIGRRPHMLGPTRREMTSVRGGGLDLAWMFPTQRPSIEKVLASSARDFYARGGHLRRSVGNYATAWALVHLLAVGADDLRPRFRAFLEALDAGDADPAELFAVHFGGLRLQSRLNDYVASGQFRNYVLHVSTPRRSPPRVHPMSEGESHLHWAWLWGTSTSDDHAARRRAHVAAAQEDAGVRARALLLEAAFHVSADDFPAAERTVSEGLGEFPDDPGLLHAAVELLLQRGADPSIPGARLRRVARTAEQICAVAAVDLATGDARQSLAHAAGGLFIRPNSRLCRQTEARALAALRQ